MNKSTKIVWKSAADLIPYEHNAKEHTETQIQNIVTSLKKYGWQNPCLITRDNVIVTGHGRIQAAKAAGILEVPCIYADGLTDEQIKEYRHLDNLLSEGAYIPEEFNIDMPDLSDFDFSEISVNLDINASGGDIDLSENPDIPLTRLSDDFVAPPFSVLDGRQGYWTERNREWRKMWRERQINDEAGRDAKAIHSSALHKFVGNYFTDGESVFSPTQLEIAYKWFNIDGGGIYDCFAGGFVRGVVAAMLGYKYKGIELREEQVIENQKVAKLLGLDDKICWLCDDSLNADNYLEDESVDMIFSCPPYVDLEKYSDDPRDLSNMEYDKFIQTYRKIINIACKKLKNDRFAVFVVGEVRDKKGRYRNFVDETKRAFVDSGLAFYNDMVLIDPVGTAAFRARKAFEAGRKVCKIHQNILVFYKGDVTKIKENWKG